MSRILILLIAASLLNSLSWIILIPVWQYPDEQAHFGQVQDMAELGKKQTPLNTSREISLSESILSTSRDSFGNNKYTYHPEFNIEYTNSLSGLYEDAIRNFPISYRKELVKREATGNPPLYYVSGAVFYKIFYSGSLFERVFAVRLFSAFLFLGLITTAYLIGKILFENKPVLVLTLASLVAFKPMLVFASTGVLPDPATNLLFSLVIFLSLLVIKRGITIGIILPVSAVILLGVLTRQQFLISVPITAGAIIFRIVKEKNVKVIFTLIGFILILLALSFLVPPLIYLREPSLPEIGKPQFNQLFKFQFMSYIKTYINESNAQTFAWYWGVYRWLTLTMPLVYYTVIKVTTVVAITGTFIFTIRNIKNTVSSKAIVLFLIYSSITYVSIIALWDYYFRQDHNYSFGLQGRYFFPMVIAHFGILLTGLLTIWRLIINKFEHIFLFALTVSMIIFNDITLFHVSSSYYNISSASVFIEQASQYKAVFLKGEVIAVIIILAFFTQGIFLYNFAKILQVKK